MTSETRNEITLDVDDLIGDGVQDAASVTKDVVIVSDDDGKPAIGFVIVGKDSEAYRKRAAELRADGIRRQASKRTRIDTKTEEGALMFGKLLEQNEFELAVAVVVDYFGLTSGGEPISCTPEMTRKLFTAKPSWREKVTAEIEAEDGFLKLSSGNSATLRAVNSA